MTDTQRRFIGYGAGAAILGVLGYAGFVYESEADTMTLVGSAEVHLKLAKSMREFDGAGNPNPVRQDLLVQARGFIDRARAQDPDVLACVEMDAYCWAQQREFATAAALYAKARRCADATPATRSADALNEVRMWRLAGQPQQSLELLERSQDKILSNDWAASQIEMVFLLSGLGRQDDAVGVAAEVAESSQDAVASVDAGLYLEEHGEGGLAAAAFERAAEQEPLANYYLARLKVRAGEFDTSLDLLRLVVASNRPQVKRLVELDSDVWNAVRDDARFRDLLAVNKAARPGR
jgi:tetratricopeptide (TPR) repeat protein